MRPRTFFAVVIGFSVLLGGCASSGGGGDEGGTLDATWNEDMGRLLLGPLEEARMKIFQKHSLNLFRQESSFNSIYWETEWIPREVTAEERAEGITRGRTRLIIRGRRVGEEPDLGQGIFRTTFEVHNQVTSQSVPEWHPAPMPEAVQEQWRQIATDLEMEVRAGVRR